MSPEANSRPTFSGFSNRGRNSTEESRRGARQNRSLSISEKIKHRKEYKQEINFD